MSSPCWRIDELAQRAGLTVDTIRYYAREGLLTPPERSGRHKLYSPDHLDRLERIRDLQARRFSLAAIKALLQEPGHPGLEAIFSRDGGRQYSFDELVERGGLDRSLVESLRDVGLIADPEDVGKEAYDEADVAVLRAIVVLVEIGMPERQITKLSEIYVRHFRALQGEVHDLFAFGGETWEPDERSAMQRRLTDNVDRMIPAVNQLLSYVHQRMAQRMTLDAVKTAEATHTGVGGVALDD